MLTVAILVLAAAVFGLGLFSLMTRPSALGALVGIGLLFNAPVIVLGEFTQLHQGTSGPPLGQGVAFVLIAIACCQLLTGAALAVFLWRRQIAAAPDAEVAQ